VTVPDRTERDHRPGGRWSSPHLIDDLLHLTVIERAAAHVTAGWVPKIAELDDKLALAAGLEGHWLRAIALRQHALTLAERDTDALTADSGWIAPLHALDHQGDGPLVIGIVSWSTAPQDNEGCGGLTGVTPLLLYRDWIIETAKKFNSPVTP